MLFFLYIPAISANFPFPHENLPLPFGRGVRVWSYREAIVFENNLIRQKSPLCGLFCHLPKHFREAEHAVKGKAPVVVALGKNNGLCDSPDSFIVPSVTKESSFGSFLSRKEQKTSLYPHKAAAEVLTATAPAASASSASARVVTSPPAMTGIPVSAKVRMVLQTRPGMSSA